MDARLRPTRLAAVALVTGAALLLGGCVHDDDPPPHPSSPEPAPSPTSAASR